jgi:hypothetical protein
MKKEKEEINENEKVIEHYTFQLVQHTTPAFSTSVSMSKMDRLFSECIGAPQI